MKKILQRTGWWLKRVGTGLHLLFTGQWKAYRRIPVSMEQFLDDPYYLGGQTTCLRPAFRKRLIEVFTQPPQELIVQGERGSGKTLFMRLIMLRLIYDHSCRCNPHEIWGLSEGSQLHIPIVDVSVPSSRRVMLDGLKEALAASPYFQERFQPTMHTDSIEWSDGLMIYASAYQNNDRHMGTNTCSAILMQTKEEVPKEFQEQARQCYRLLADRYRSRCVKPYQPGPGMTLLNGGWVDRWTGQSPWLDEPGQRQGVYLTCRQ